MIPVHVRYTEDILVGLIVDPRLWSNDAHVRPYASATVINGAKYGIKKTL